MVSVADTHALIWFLSNDERLGVAARQVFRKAEKGEDIIIIPTISLMELLYICKKKESIEEFEELLKCLKKSLNYIVFDLTLETVMESVNLTKVEEMHDRIIVATAKITNSAIITRDTNIREENYGLIIW